MFKYVPPDLEVPLALEVAVGLYVVCNPRYTTSELAEDIIVVFARVSFIPVCEVPFINRTLVPFLKLLRRKH